MDDLISVGRALPIYASLPVTVVGAILLVIALRSTRSIALLFAVAAIWLRVTLSAFHQYTYVPFVAGLSGNALASIMMCILGLLVVRRRVVGDRAIVPFYPIFFAIIASGVVNSSAVGALDMFVKNAYLAVMTLAVADGMADEGWDQALGKLILPFAIPLGLQAVSIALGVVKVSSQDGSASYIGGYEHEAAFSVMMAAGLLALCLRERMAAWAKAGATILLVGSILLANYRTTIVSMLPLLAIVALIGVTRRVMPQQRAIVLLGTIMLATTGLGAVATLSADRFQDIGVAFEQAGSLMKPTREYTPEERHIMSGRPVIWAGYIFGYADGLPMQHLFGLGPSSWENEFTVYAHNTLVSALYELGIAGVIAILLLWAAMAALVLRVPHWRRTTLIAAHLSFFVLNMGTMPMWMIEGMILYGILCGATIYASGADADGKRWAR